MPNSSFHAVFVLISVMSVITIHLKGGMSHHKVEITAYGNNLILTIVVLNNIEDGKETYKMFLCQNLNGYCLFVDFMLHYNICAAYVYVSHQLRCFLLTAMCPHCEACSAMSNPRMSSWVHPNAWPLWNPLTWKCKGHTAVERQHAPILLLDLHHQILPRSNMISIAAFNRLIQILNEGWLVGSRWDRKNL